MARILAIDYGKKRVGLAVTDPLKIIATPLDTVASEEVLNFLKNYVESEDVETFVVGKPQNLDGSDTDASQLVEHFVEILKKHFSDTPIHLHDERFTSRMALQSMIAAGSRKKDRQNKANIDKVSAAIILQSFLESQV